MVRSGGERLELSAPPDCPGFVRAVDGGRVLFACEQTHPVPSDPRHADFAIVPDGARFGMWISSYNEQQTLDQLGEHWVAGPYYGYHLADQQFFGWRTGNTVLGGSDGFGQHRFLDPSLAGLGRPLCQPLRRRLHPGRDGYNRYPRYQPIQVWRGWVLEGWIGTASLQGDPLVVRRCGTPASRTLHEGGSARIGSGWVTWIPASASEPKRIARALRLRDGHTRYWVTSRNARVAHTADALYATEPVGLPWDPEGYRVLRGSLR